jgi:hypothetical protein
MGKTKWEYRHRNRLQPKHSVWQPCTEENKKLLETKWTGRYEFRLRAKGTPPKGAVVEDQD